MKILNFAIGRNAGVSLTCYLQDVRLFGAKTPAVVVCPGGGYIYHNETEGENVAMSFYAQGFSAFVLHYSVGLQAIWPQTVVDAALAIKLIRDHAAQWDIAPDAIAIGGFSAGGHMAAAAATMWDLPEVHAAAGAADAEGRPDAAFLIYPAVDICLPAIENGRLYNRRVNCAAQVDQGTPPVFMVHTYGDTVAPLEQSLLFAKAMYDHDRPVECHFYTFGQHSSLVRRRVCVNARGIHIPNYNDWMPRCVEWLWDIFGRDRADMQADTAPDNVKDWARPHGGSLGNMMESDGRLFEEIFGYPQPQPPGVSSRSPLGELLQEPEKRAILEAYFPILRQTNLSDFGKNMRLARLMAMYGYREDDMCPELPVVTGEMAEMLKELNASD